MELDTMREQVARMVRECCDVSLLDLVGKIIVECGRG